MRHVALFTIATMALGCSKSWMAHDRGTEGALGTVEIDFAEGPHVVDLEMSLAKHADASSCEAFDPRFELRWTGDEGEARMEVATDAEAWDEDVMLEDGEAVTTVRGTFEVDGCTFRATLWVDSDEPIAGFLNVNGVASTHSETESAGTLTGSVEGYPDDGDEVSTGS